MNYVMVDQQSGVDLIKQRWGLFKIVWLLGTTFAALKGQVISKCPYEKSVSSKIPTKIFLEFCPDIFCSFLGASWKLFGLYGDLVSNITYKEAYRKHQKLPGSPKEATKNCRAEIQK